MSEQPPEKTLDRIIQERREKGQALRQAGSDPYRNDVVPTTTIADVRAWYPKARPRSPARPFWPISGLAITPGPTAPINHLSCRTGRLAAAMAERAGACYI